MSDASEARSASFDWNRARVRWVCDAVEGFENYLS